MKETDATSELFARRVRQETELLSHEAELGLREKNPALYVCLHSEPVTFGSLQTEQRLRQMTSEERSQTVRLSSSATFFDLYEYTGDQAVSFPGYVLRPHDLYWDFHVRFVDGEDHTPVQRMHEVFQDIQDILALRDKKNASVQELQIKAATAKQSETPILGKVSHLGTLIHRFLPENAWSADETLPPDLVQTYTELMQWAVEEAHGTRTVRPSDLYSVFLTAETISQLPMASQVHRS